MKKQNSMSKKEKQEKILKKRELTEQEIQEIDEKLSKETPPSGFVHRTTKTDEENKEEWAKPKIYFKDVALSKRTIRGLNEHKYVKLTPIQRAVLPHALAGRDILGTSKTGSGKTLCFVIPILEQLYREKWSSIDGLGALVIVPTRELAIQVFEVFNKVGKFHDFSVGLVIGGNNLEEEKSNIYKMNILIGTPGRLNHHLSETAYFSTDNLKVLVIDEADRILDEGFEDEITEMNGYLPMDRITWLFSATLSKSIKKLAQMNLKSPEFISLHNVESVVDDIDTTDNSKINLNLKKDENENNENENKNNVIPVSLNQFYTLAEHHEKVNILFSFFKTHKNIKCIVFLSSCKQVRYFYEVFKRLKLGITFFELHGRQSQTKRTFIFYNYMNKTNSVLFATDIAARGIDIPSVDWVIQLDCPEDMATYIHRIGRTARYKSKGNSLIVLNKAEEKFIDKLNRKGIEIRKIKVNPQKMVNLQPIVRSILSENKDIVHLAQKAISSYVKCVYIQKDKSIFDFKNIDINKLSLSYGLMTLPEMKIISTSQNNLKNESRSMNVNNMIDDEYENVNAANTNEDNNKKKSKLAKLKEKIKQNKLNKQQNINKTNEAEEEDNDDEFLQVKRSTVNDLEDDEEMEKVPEKPTKNASKTKQDLKNIADTDFINKVKEKLIVNNEKDFIRDKLRITEKHKKDKLRRKQQDYDKHGVGLEDEESEEDVEYQEYQEEEEINEKPKKKKTNELKIAKNSSIKDKEKAVLEIIEKEPMFK